MFRIGEFSKLTQVSIRMLRYYDEMGLLKPAHTDPFTNYRLYSTEQIPRLNKIVFLRDLGFNVSQIAEALEGLGDQSIARLLENKRAEIEESIRLEQEKLQRIEQAKRDIERKQIQVHYSVLIKEVPAQKVFSLRRRVPDYYAEGQLWKEMGAFVHANNICVSQNTFTIYHDLDYRETDVDMEVCAPVKELAESRDGFTFREAEAVAKMACTMVYGPFENIKGAFLSFAGWLQAHERYKMAGTSRQIVHRGPWNEEDSSKHLTEIQIPLEERG